jgi:K+-transporting ATPase KdpF subunit
MVPSGGLRRGGHGGCPDHRLDGSALDFNPRVDPRLDAADGAVRNMVVLAGILSVGLFIYLVCALLKPEWFV